MIVVVLLVVAALGAWTWKNDGYLFGIATPLAAPDYEGPGGETVQVEIPQGAVGAGIGQVLVENDVVASLGAFGRAYRSNPAAVGIQPGTHTLQLRMSAEAAVAALAQNKVDRGGLTIPEGRVVTQVKQAMIEAGWPEKQVEKAFSDPKAVGLPSVADGNFEGWLFPNTYDVKPKNDSARDVVAKMIGQAVGVLDDVGVPEPRREEILIKASLIEREAARPEDRPRMSGVIKRRIEENWTLGIDAAVLYGTGRTHGALTKAELTDESNPYNLREHEGLPPTPISNPGRASIEAALNPAEGTEMYWVTVNHDSGETKFATTEAEFNELVAQLRQWEAEHPDWAE